MIERHPVLKIEDIQAINFEISSRCAANCPFCSRGHKIRDYGNYDITLADFKRLPQTLISQLKRTSFGGNFGDLCANPEFVDIVSHIKTINQNVVMDGETNGSLRDAGWWRRLGEVFHPGGLIFALDGLEDTHHLHRRGTRFDHVTRHLEAFVSGGGSAYWKFIVFEHNEHQIASAESLAKELGCSGFFVVSSREYTPHFRMPKTLDVEIKRDIYHTYLDRLSGDDRRALCKPFNNGSIYIAADGTVHPCCLAHCIYISEHNLAFDYIVPLIEQYRSQINFKTKEIKDIVEGPYFKAVERQSPANAYCQLKCNRYRKVVREKLTLYEKRWLN
jgi:MoaA/NifB/PqqE/SkfB family radical SAM enzyme